MPMSTLSNCPVALQHLRGLTSGSLRLVKTSPALPETAEPGAPPVAQAGAAPPMLPSATGRPPQAPQDAQAAAPALGFQTAAEPPQDNGTVLGHSPGGPLLAPVRDATAVADCIRRQPNPASAGGGVCPG